jgi:hypothetical protein
MRHFLRLNRVVCAILRRYGSGTCKMAISFNRHTSFAMVSPPRCDVQSYWTRPLPTILHAPHWWGELHGYHVLTAPGSAGPSMTAAR